MSDKSFHLRWNNHLQNIQRLFENLFNEQALVDVTICCTDGLLYGHKLVLSACSPYFEQVFRDNPCEHPIVILKGISHNEMQVLLEYMYKGSVDVGEGDLESLLDTATELQIKGLVQCAEEPFQYSDYRKGQLDKVQHSSKDFHNAVDPSSPNSSYIDNLSWQAELITKPTGMKHKENNLPNKQLIQPRHDSKKEEDISNKKITAQIKEEPSNIKIECTYSDEAHEEMTKTQDYQQNSEEEVKEFSQGESVEESSDNMQISYSNPVIKNSTDGDETSFLCHICSRAFQNKGSYHRHMMTHAGVKPHRCTFCEQSFLRLSHLQRHIRVHTGERPYACSHCSKQFARSDKLRQHYIIQHHDVKVSKARGRPRKYPGLYPSSAPASAYRSAVNPAYDVTINPVSMNAV